MTTTIATLKAGQSVRAGYSQYVNSNEFLGFFTDREGTGKGFATLAELRANVADTDCYYALFRDVEGDFGWAAYYWNKRWRVGSSAHTLKLAAA